MLGNLERIANIAFTVISTYALIKTLKDDEKKK